MIKINAHRILVRMPKEKDQLEDLGIDGKTIFKLFLEEQNMEVWHELTRDSISRLTSVDTVTDIHIPQELGKFSNKLISSFQGSSRNILTC
jgi:hypothetical protein